MYAVDPNPAKLAVAAGLGAIAVDGKADPVVELLDGGGVDVALDLVGSAAVMRNCLDSLAPMGRAVAVGLTPNSMPVGPYTDLVAGESELIGASDHLASEIRELLAHAASGALNFDGIVAERIPLEPGPVNQALDRLEEFAGPVRTVINP